MLASVQDELADLFWSNNRPPETASHLAQQYLSHYTAQTQHSRHERESYLQAQLLLAEVEFDSHKNKELHTRLAQLLPQLEHWQQDVYQALALYYKGLLLGLREEQPEKSEPYLKQGVTLIDKHWKTSSSVPRRTLQIAEGLHENLGRLYAHFHENHQALIHLKTAGALERRLEDPHQEAWVNAYIGAVYKNMKQLTTASDYYFKALSAAEVNKDPKLKAYAAVRLGNVYSESKNYAAAVQLLTQAIKSYEQLKDTKQIAKTLNMLGEVYLNKNDTESALLNFLDAKGMFEQLSDQYNLGQVCHNIASAYLMQHELNKAQAYAEQELHIYQQLNHASFTARALELLARIAMADNDFETAKTNLQKGLALARSKQDDVYINAYTQTLTRLLAAEGNYKAAYEQMSHLTEVRERLITKAQRAAIHNLQTEYDLQKENYQQQEHINSLSKMTQVINQQWRWLVFSIVLNLCLMLLLANRFHLLRQLRQRRVRDIMKRQRDPLTNLANREAYLKWIEQYVDTLHHQVDREPEATVHPMTLCMANLGAFHNNYEYVGYQIGRRNEEQFGHFIERHFPAPFKTYLVTSQRLIVSHPELSTYDLGDYVQGKLNKFWKERFNESPCCTLGVMSLPFVNRAAKATDRQLVAEVLYLACAAAQQLTQRFNESSWVALSAIDNTPPTLFAQDPRSGLLLAVRKGFIKVHSRLDKQFIDWDVIAAHGAQKNGSEK